MTTPIFHDGFDVYGAPGTLNATIQALLLHNWTTTSIGGSTTSIVAGLSSTGYALSINGQATIAKTLPGNYSRIVGTMRINSNLGGGTGQAGILFRDTTNVQCSLLIEGSGTINLRSGGTSGTILGGSASPVSASSTHVLSWDITIGTSASYQVWLDGTSIISGTGNTRAGSSNNYVNAITPGNHLGNATSIWDDFVLINGSLSFDSTVLTSNPRIETQFPTSDVQTQFSNIGTILGSAAILTTSTNSAGGNQLFLRRYTPEANETINSVSIMPAQTSATAKFKAAIYPDSAGSPNGQTLMSGGTEVTGCTSGTALVCPLTTPQSLVAGTFYWIGLITDTAITWSLNDTGANGVRATGVTYSTGPPATCPTMTTGQSNWCIYGNCTGATVNWPALDHNPAPGDISHVSSFSPTNEDLLGFPALSASPTTIFFAAVMANVKRSDAGARTLDLRVKSDTTSDSGSNTGISPALSYGWVTSYWDEDPDTSAAWTESGWNAASSGYRIAA